jgi:SAM-dependent methyltransferase
MAIAERSRRVARRLPAPVRDRLARVAGHPAIRRSLRPVRWGNLRRSAPVSRRYGFDRGTPIDRVYLDQFFRARAADIRGRVLEVDAPVFTERHADPAAVTAVDVVDVDGRNDRATILADLADPGALPTESFDCVVLPQTLQYVSDPSIAVANLWSALAPGGVLLLTVPAVAKIDHHARDVDAWRWVPNGLRAQLVRGCPGGEIEVSAFGNALSGAAFLVGASAEDLGDHRVAEVDPEFPVLVAARVRKPAGS